MKFSVSVSSDPALQSTWFFSPTITFPVHQKSFLLFSVHLPAISYQATYAINTRRSLFTAFHSELFCRPFLVNRRRQWRTMQKCRTGGYLNCRLLLHITVLL